MKLSGALKPQHQQHRDEQRQDNICNIVAAAAAAAATTTTITTATAITATATTTTQQTTSKSIITSQEEVVEEEEENIAEIKQKLEQHQRLQQLQQLQHERTTEQVDAVELSSGVLQIDYNCNDYDVNEVVLGKYCRPQRYFTLIPVDKNVVTALTHEQCDAAGGSSVLEAKQVVKNKTESPKIVRKYNIQQELLKQELKLQSTLAIIENNKRPAEEAALNTKEYKSNNCNNNKLINFYRTTKKHCNNNNNNTTTRQFKQQQHEQHQQQQQHEQINQNATNCKQAQLKETIEKTANFSAQKAQSSNNNTKAAAFINNRVNKNSNSSSANLNQIYENLFFLLFLRIISLFFNNFRNNIAPTTVALLKTGRQNINSLISNSFNWAADWHCRRAVSNKIMRASQSFNNKTKKQHATATTTTTSNKATTIKNVYKSRFSTSSSSSSLSTTSSLWLPATTSLLPSKTRSIQFSSKGKLSNLIKNFSCCYWSSIPSIALFTVVIFLALPPAQFAVRADENDNFFPNGISLETTTPEFDYASRGQKKFGDKCDNTLECGFPGSICDPKKKSCQCTEDLPVTNHIDKCGKEAAVNESCFFNEQCEVKYFQTECRDGRCVCRFDMTPTWLKDGSVECKGRGDKKGPETYIDPAMIGVLIGMALMFIIICVVLRLFSQARWRENRTIFNTPNPRLMNVSLLRESKLLHGQERRGSRMSVRAPSRQPSMASLRPHSPNPSLGKTGRMIRSKSNTRSSDSRVSDASNCSRLLEHHHHHHHHHQQQQQQHQHSNNSHHNPHTTSASAATHGGSYHGPHSVSANVSPSASSPQPAPPSLQANTNNTTTATHNNATNNITYVSQLPEMDDTTASSSGNALATPPPTITVIPNKF